MKNQHYANGQKVYEQKGHIRTHFFKTGDIRATGSGFFISFFLISVLRTK